MHSNLISFSYERDTRLSYSPANWPGVVAAKARYDPHNLLREVGAPVAPSTCTAATVC